MKEDGTAVNRATNAKSFDIPFSLFQFRRTTDQPTNHSNERMNERFDDPTNKWFGALEPLLYGRMCCDCPVYFSEVSFTLSAAPYHC